MKRKSQGDAYVISNDKKFEVDNIYKFNRNRTGIYNKEDSKFIEKYKIENIIKILKNNNVEYEFDSMVNSNDFRLSFTGCNYGVLLFLANPYFDTFLYSNNIENRKKLPKNFDIDLNINDKINKYYNIEDKFFKKIETLIVLSSVAKHPILNWKLINELMNQENSYLKFHPILDYETKQHFANKYGISKLISSYYILDELILKSKNIALSGCTESIITSALLNKNIIFLNKPHLRINKVFLSYYVLYKSIYNGYNINDIVNTGCSNLIPWKYINDEAFINEYLKFLKKNYNDWQHSIHNNTYQK